MTITQVKKRLAACLPIGAALGLALSLASCSQNVDSKYGVTSSVRVVGPGKPVPKGGGYFRVGNPYVIAGRTYVPREDDNYRAEGLASWYGSDFHGRLTANGEVYDMFALSAAHPTLPLPSYVRVTNLANGRSVIVRVNDRGPYHDNRLIDLSVRTAKLLDFYDRGVTKVRVEYVGRAALSGSDDAKLAHSLRIDEPNSLIPRVATTTPNPQLAPPETVISYASTQIPSLPMLEPQLSAPAVQPNPAISYAQDITHSTVVMGRGLY
jgi:rare lipoprotein A (peptidoglycan hydrolase)